MAWIFRAGEENTAARCRHRARISTVRAVFGLARRNVQWTFRRPNARRAEERKRRPSRTSQTRSTRWKDEANCNRFSLFFRVLAASPFACSARTASLGASGQTAKYRRSNDSNLTHHALASASCFSTWLGNGKVLQRRRVRTANPRHDSPRQIAACLAEIFIDGQDFRRKPRQNT